MKSTTKILFTIIFLLVTIATSEAQKFYLNLDGSYGFNASSASYGNTSTLNIPNLTVYNGGTINYNYSSGETGNSSLATGINSGLIIGYNLTKHFNVEVGAFYVPGTTVSYNFSNIYPGMEANFTDNWKASLIRIIPTIKITGDSARMIPYAKIGLALGINPSMTNDETGTQIVTDFNTNTTAVIPREVIAKFTGSMAIGIMAALGVDYSINTRFGVFGELNYIGMSWAPTRSSVTKYTINGIDNLPYLSTFETQVNYVNSYTPNFNPDSNQPSTALKHYFPLSTWGFNVGIKYSFGKKA